MGFFGNEMPLTVKEIPKEETYNKYGGAIIGELKANLLGNIGRSAECLFRQIPEGCP